MSALSTSPFPTQMDVLTAAVRREAPWNIMLVNDLLLLNDRERESEEGLERWRNALEIRGLKAS